MPEQLARTSTEFVNKTKKEFKELSVKLFPCTQSQPKYFLPLSKYSRTLKEKWKGPEEDKTVP